MPPMSIIEIARRLQAPDLCPVCRQDWRQASCSHQGADLEHLCSEEIDRLCGWYVEHLGAEVPLHFTAFHPDFKLLDVSATSAITLRRAREQALRVGLKHVYTGNVRDVAGQSTYCAGCGARLIGRDGYEVGAWQVDPGGHCVSCGARLAGCFDPQPGTWGARRQRVSVGRA